MEVTTALLCDFAQVRDNVLFVVAGGVTRMWRQQLPAPMAVCLALVIEQDQFEMRRQHELQVIVVDQDGDQLADVTGGFQVGGGELEAGDNVSVPVALDLRSVGLRAYGPHEVRVYVDGQHRRTLQFRVNSRPPAGGGGPQSMEA